MELGKELTGILGTFLERPELLRGLLGSLGNAGRKSVDGDGDTQREKRSTYGRCGAKEHSALLCAMKPYLSKKRCDTIDALIALLSIISAVG